MTGKTLQRMSGFPGDMEYSVPPTDNLLYLMFEFSLQIHVESTVNDETGGKS
jgi:hypothetical protein